MKKVKTTRLTRGMVVRLGDELCELCSMRVYKKRCGRAYISFQARSLVTGEIETDLYGIPVDPEAEVCVYSESDILEWKRGVYPVLCMEKYLRGQV